MPRKKIKLWQVVAVVACSTESRVRVPSIIVFKLTISIWHLQLFVMRNLAQISVQVVSLNAEDVGQFSSALPEDAAATLSATAFDIDRGITFAATECRGEILIWKTSEDQLFSQKEPSFYFCGSYATPDPYISSLRVLAETSRLALITRAGDIVVWELGDSGDFNVGDLPFITLLY